jgi:hypothetical protein
VQTNPAGWIFKVVHGLGRAIFYSPNESLSYGFNELTKRGDTASLDVNNIEVMPVSSVIGSADNDDWFLEQMRRREVYLAKFFCDVVLKKHHFGPSDSNFRTPVLKLIVADSYEQAKKQAETITQGYTLRYYSQGFIDKIHEDERSFKITFDALKRILNMSDLLKNMPLITCPSENPHAG